MKNIPEPVRIFLAALLISAIVADVVGFAIGLGYFLFANAPERAAGFLMCGGGVAAGVGLLMAFAGSMASAPTRKTSRMESIGLAMFALGSLAAIGPLVFFVIRWVS